ncbi:MAG: bifunctional GNAT family N-acetyltransferase/carbon-nitrogen hydrolase family protein [Flavobacteriales bacterium]
MSNDMRIRLRHLKLEDFQNLRDAMVQAYPDMAGAIWREEHIRTLIDLFPEGQLCVTVNGKVVASALSIIVDYDLYGDNHTYRQITGNYTFKTHDPSGDVLYGIDVFVHPEHRGLRLARRLYEARKELCERLNLKSIIAGGRIPNYATVADKMSPRAYIEKVRMKELYDPTLTFQLSNDFHVLKVMQGYLEGDTSSREYATLIEWNNIYYDQRPKIAGRANEVVRLGLVQWQMRPMSNLEALCDQVEFFVDAVSSYKADFCLFPELFNAPLLAEFNHLDEAAAMRGLARYTEPLLQKFIDYAIRYNVNIITGSLPLLEGEHLKNVGYLCRRDGTWEKFEKVHITPNEVQYWGMLGGDEVRVFDTDCGKVGILICYDVEFPELSRLLAMQGMQILFVPFLTDTQNGYMRVRRCAQARAIENECYVAIAGSVGNLPKVENMDIQFAQSAVFTPSDFAFPTNGIKSEATPNTEMTLIVDVDRDLLKELNAHGSVRIMRDRRTDLYELKLLKNAPAPAKPPRRKSASNTAS